MSSMTQQNSTTSWRVVETVRSYDTYEDFSVDHANQSEEPKRFSYAEFMLALCVSLVLYYLLRTAVNFTLEVMRCLLS